MVLKMVLKKNLMKLFLHFKVPPKFKSFNFLEQPKDVKCKCEASIQLSRLDISIQTRKQNPASNYYLFFSSK